MKNRAFTLIELLVVISVIALLASISLAALNVARAKAVLSASKLQNSNILHAIGDSGLIQFDFDECSGTVVGDLSGSGNVGNVINTPSWPTTTYSGQGCALTLNGTTQYVQVPTSVSVSAQNFTSTAWFRTSSAGDRKIISINATSHPIQIFSNTLRSCINGNCQLGTTNIADNNWHFVVVVGTTVGIQVYLDGKGSLEIPIFSAPGTITGTPNIGAAVGPADYFPGSIDEVRLYSRNLTSMEIKDIYLAGTYAHGVKLADLK